MGEDSVHYYRHTSAVEGSCLNEEERGIPS